MGDLYASGVTTVEALRAKIRDFLNSVSSDEISKRSIDSSDIMQNKKEIIDLVMQIVNGIGKFSEKVKANIKAEIAKLYESGKLRLWNLYQTVKDLINKYNPLSDEFEDEIQEDLQKMSEIYKAARQAIKKALESIITLAKNTGFSLAEVRKMVEELYQAAVKDLDDSIMDALN